MRISRTFTRHSVCVFLSRLAFTVQQNGSRNRDMAEEAKAGPSSESLPKPRENLFCHWEGQIYSISASFYSGIG